MSGYWFDATPLSSATQAHSCNCVGPRNGDPVCRCMMPEHNRRKMADWAMEAFMGKHKPRIRVKAGRREVPA